MNTSSAPDRKVRLSVSNPPATGGAAALAAPAPVLVSGTVAYDDIITPDASGTRLLGGSASYAALACSFFAETRLAGMVGADFAGADIARFRRRGVDISALAVDPSGETFFWRGRYHENRNRRDTLETRLGVNAGTRPPLPAGFRDAPVVLLANDEPRLQLDILAQLSAPRLVIADSMNLWIDIAREDLGRVIARAGLLILNDEEARQLTGEGNLVLAGRRLLAFGPRTVVVKRGEHGATMFHEAGLFAVPAYPVTSVLDPTGAGDSFAGALAGALAALGRDDLSARKAAMLYATAVAGLTVESFSCDRLESAGAPEIENRVAILRDMMRE